MNEGQWSDLFTGIAAHRAGLVDATGRLVVLAVQVRDAGLDDIADQMDAACRELAAGIETLTRIADGAQDDTQTMSLDEVADG